MISTETRLWTMSMFGTMNFVGGGGSTATIRFVTNCGTPSTIGSKTLAFVVKERQAINPEEMKKSLATLRTELLPTKREQYFNAYVQEVRKRMQDEGNIQINESIMTQLAQSVS